MDFPITHSATTPIPDQWEASPTHVNRIFPINNAYEIDDFMAVFPFYVNKGNLDRADRLQVIEYMAAHARDLWAFRLGYVEALPYHSVPLAGYVFFFDAGDAAMFKLAFGGT